MINFRLGRTGEDTPVAAVAHRQGVLLILSDIVFSEEQVAALNSGVAGWLSIADVWQLWKGEIVDLSEVGPEPQLMLRQPVR